MKVYAVYGKFNAKPWDLENDFEKLSNPKIAGFSVRFTWRRINKHGWGHVRKIFDIAERLGKPFFIRFISGAWCPDFVYDQCETFDFAYSDTNEGIPDNPNYEKRTLKMPVPWDDKYLDLLNVFLRNFRNKFRDRFNLLAGVHISGGGWQGEMNMPNKFDAIKRWEREYDYDNSKIYYAWQRLIDMYMYQCRRVPLFMLAIQEPLSHARGHKAMPVIVDYALTKGCAIQFNGLGPGLKRWDLNQTKGNRQMLRRHILHTTGYRTGDGSAMASSDTFADDLWNIADTAISDGVDYVELHAQILFKNEPVVAEILDCLSKSHQYLPGIL